LATRSRTGTSNGAGRGAARLDDAPTLTLPDGSECAVRDGVAIGRGAQNDVRVDTQSVSREHALLSFRDGRWCIEDRGSANGTFVNGIRLPSGVGHPLRHADRVTVGSETLVFSWPSYEPGPDETDPLEDVPLTEPVVLSPFQLQVVRCLCNPWLGGSSLDQLPSNEEIAAQLGTPGAGDTVKAALRRAYAKTGLANEPAHVKRRLLCRVARQRGWI
jgi:hypothetical protein